ncbi:MAG: helix-turn-helix domain-containing protein, partial [Thermodesulfovibrionales bacterium]|nr:helix-turn-helix domain-containing protein [Thermodesulfovibrionales bacterium]
VRPFFTLFHFHTRKFTLPVMLYLLEGKSFREAADMAGLDKDTVQRIWKKFIASCEESMEMLLREFNIGLEDLIRLLYRRNAKGRA